MVQLVDEHPLVLGSAPFLVECRSQPLLAFVQLLQPGPGLVLPKPAPQGGAGDTHQRAGMERALQKNHVAEKLGEARQSWIALNSAAATREEHEGEVRPRR